MAAGSLEVELPLEILVVRVVQKWMVFFVGGLVQVAVVHSINSRVDGGLLKATCTQTLSISVHRWIV